MKRLIPILLLCFLTIGFVSEAQTKTDSTSLTKEKVYEDAKAAIQQLAAALQVGAEHVYGVLVKQQVVNAITWIAIDSFWLLAAITFITVLYKQLENLKEWQSQGDGYEARDGRGVLIGLLVSGCVLASLIAIFCTVMTIDDIVAGLVNPEYGAIKDIMTFIK